ncbi:Uncharacterised protein [Moraxella lacunata]|uniref:Uncharacterized protein n=1 Tax=Moraxella lacunata TaxID=477 RepID=A0A378TUA3_MORLA|nr:Uncharacterised protein [Moraxella lacunata]
MYFSLTMPNNIRIINNHQTVSHSLLQNLKITSRPESEYSGLFLFILLCIKVDDNLCI